MDSLPVSTDTDATLSNFALGLEHPNLHHRLGVLEALVAWLSPSPSQGNPCEPFSKPQARVLIRQLLSALCSPQYLERVWVVGLHKAIRAAARSTRCPTFTPMCVLNLAGECSRCGCRLIAHMHSIGCLVLQQERDVCWQSCPNHLIFMYIIKYAYVIRGLPKYLHMQTRMQCSHVYLCVHNSRCTI